MAISHCYWHLVVKNGHFTLLLTSSGEEWQFHIATDNQVKEWQFYIATDIQWSRIVISHCSWHLVVQMAISHCYWDLVVKNVNFTLQLTSSGQEWPFHTATDIQWSKMAISHWNWHLAVRMSISHNYWHLEVENGNFTLLLTSSGEEWQFHIATDI